MAFSDTKWYLLALKTPLFQQPVRRAIIIEKALEQSGAFLFAQIKELWDIAGS
jgi:hypothetical protein